MKYEQPPIIPLPREMTISGSKQIDPGALLLAIGPSVPGNHPFVLAAVRLLERERNESLRESFIIKLSMEGADEAEQEVMKKLNSVKNPEQSYGILPMYREDVMTGLVILAVSPYGLYAGARSLEASIQKEGNRLVIPDIRIIDWPEIAGRAQWGGDIEHSTGLMGRWKLNEGAVYADITGDVQVKVGLSREKLDEIRSNGLDLVPYLRHLEIMAQYAGFLGNTEVANTPDPAKPLPPEYIPGLCMSSPATEEMVARWLTAIAELKEIPAIEIRLSEDRTPCYCSQCKGKEPYILETKLVERAFKAVREKHPRIRLRLLLSQGSYHYNHLVLDAADPDTQITYYDGGRTYDSSHAPMIYPLLEKTAKSGRWLGVYPQITHSWRTVFPFTGPQFIHCRCSEFAEKGLSNVTGYAVPTNRHHEFNVMALAEWSWNPEGRPPEEFCRAYARIKGIDPELFTSWALLAGDAGWWFAESNLLLRLIYSYDLSFSLTGTDGQDHRFSRSGIRYKRPVIEEALEKSRRALRIAEDSGIDNLIDESKALTGGLEALLAIDDLRSAGFPKGDAGRIMAILSRLDTAAGMLDQGTDRWGTRINREIYGGKPYTNMIRHRDTCNVLYRLTDHLWREFTRETGGADPRMEEREQPLGAWNRGSFSSGFETVLRFDITGYTAPPASSYLCFTYTSGDFAAFISQVYLVSVKDGAEKVIGHTLDESSRIGRWARWREYKLPVPGQNSGKLYAAVKLQAMYLENYGDAEWECSGKIGIRTPKF